MTMYTGTAVGPTALLQALKANLTADIYSLRSNFTEGTGQRLHVSAAALFVNFRSATNESSILNGNVSGLGINVSTNFDISKGWAAQPGAPVDYSSQPVSKSIPIGATTSCNYWLIVEPTYAFFAVETSAGQCAVMGWGWLDNTAGAFTGGQFFFAEAPNGQYKSIFNATGSLVVRADVDTFKGKWLVTSNGTSDTTYGYTGKHAGVSNQVSGARFPSFNDIVDSATAASADGVAPMLPAHVYVNRDSGSWSWLGTVPGIFMCRRLPWPTSTARGTALRLGSDNYTLFPGIAVRHDSPARAAATGSVFRADSALQEYRGKLLPTIQALPGGSITAAQATSFRLWNVDGRHQAVVATINQPDIYGLTVTPAAPFVLLPGASMPVTVTILPDGRPFVTDKVQFYVESLGALSPYVDANYYRALPFPLQPEGGAGFTEKLTWPSSLLTAFSGKEQRASLVTRPRRVISCTLTPADQGEVELAETLLYQGQSRLFAAPRWPDARTLTAAAPAGSLSVQVDTSYGIFQSYALAYTSRTSCIVLPIAAVGTGVLQLSAPIAAALPAGTIIAPAMFSRVDSEFGVSIELSTLANYTLTFTEEV